MQPAGVDSQRQSRRETANNRAALGHKQHWDKHSVSDWLLGMCFRNRGGDD